MSSYRFFTFDELCEGLALPCPTLILLRCAPDADTVGSAFALRRVLEDLGSEAWCLCSEEPDSRFSFLYRDLQESLLPESLPEGFLPQRVIAVDAPSLSRLGELGEVYEGEVDFSICKQGDELFANTYRPNGVAATGEILFDVVKYFAEQHTVRITEALCDQLYAAISWATAGFCNGSVTADTHLRTAELVSFGINCAAINHRLHHSRSMEQLRAIAAGISNLHLFAEGRVAVVLFPYAIKAALGLENGDLDGLMEVARAPEDAQLSIVIRQPSTEALFRVTARSNGSFNIASLCECFGGGGNSRAASCTLHAADGEAAMEKLIAAIDFSLFN
ncbi:MAG: hypothetical protein E7620_03870 [Ruminococcaceae bacterium]|nr:hypothetical protein [Oscillospiraceae bacterium]